MHIHPSKHFITSPLLALSLASTLLTGCWLFPKKSSEEVDSPSTQVTTPADDHSKDGTHVDNKPTPPAPPPVTPPEPPKPVVPPENKIKALMQSVSTLSATATGDERFVVHTVQDPTITLDLDLGIPIKEELRLPTGTKIAISRAKANFKDAQGVCSQLTLSSTEAGSWYAPRSAKDTAVLEATPTHKITIEQLAEYLGSSKWRDIGFNPFFWSSSQGCLDHYAGYGVNLDGAVPMCANIKYQYAVICVQ